MRNKLSKYNKLLLIHTIFEIVLLIICVVLLQFFITFSFILNILISILLIINGVITIVYTVLTYSRTSADDYLWGNRLEFIGFVLVSTIVAVFLIIKSLS